MMLIALQPVGTYQTTVSHINAWDVPFDMNDSGLLCFKGLQSDRPKCSASLVDPRAFQNMIIKYLLVGLWTRCLYQQVVLIPLFQMRYERLPNSENQPSDSQRGCGNPCFHLSLLLLSPPASKTWLFNFVSHSVTSWSRLGHHILFERGDLELSLGTKFLKFSIIWV